MNNRGIILMVLSCWVAACSAHDEHYYSLHPNALQKEIIKCTEQQPKKSACDKLKQVAFKINNLAYQLRTNPLEYGKQILNLQETIAKQQKALQQGVNQTDLQASLNQNQRHLQERLAIVKWLESPKS